MATSMVMICALAAALCAAGALLWDPHGLACLFWANAWRKCGVGSGEWLWLDFRSRWRRTKVRQKNSSGSLQAFKIGVEAFNRRDSDFRAWKYALVQ